MKRNKFLSLILLVCITLCFFPAEQTFAATKKEPSDQKVSFNFVDVDLGAITKFISEITKKNFIFDERVKGKITIITPSKLSIDDAYNLFVSVLELKGYMVVPSGVDAFKIIPTAEAKQKGIKVTKDRSVNDSYIARLIKLKSISSDDALRLIQPVISKDGYISAFGPANMLLVIDSGLNIEKVLSIIETVDQPYSSEEPEIILLKHSSADAVAKMLNEGMSRKPRIGQQAYATEEAKAVADTRLNAVVLFGDKGAREAIKSLIRLLDVPSPEAQGRVNVYFLENADAVELAKVMEGMLRGMQPSRQLGGQGAPVAPFEAAGGITITADKATNSLVVVASPADYQNLAQIIKQLDKRRKQVFVEAMIAEISVDNLLELGTKFRGAATKNGKPIFVGGVGQVDQSTIKNIVTGLAGLTLGGVGKYFTIPKDFIPGATSDMTVPGLAAIFNLDEFKDAVNVLSTPQILTSDNKEAEILVGENVPFISKRERDITTTNTVLNSIERQDVGIKLKLTPQITEGDYVKLDIYQEISSLQQQSDAILINVGPTITKRSTKTSVVVRDKQTVVIGGLMQERDEQTTTKVPVLGDIPGLGWLFKSKSTSKKKTNLMVFITPHLVKEGESLAQITRDKQTEFSREGQGRLVHADGELSVKFKEDVPADKALALISQKDASVTGFTESTKVYKIRPRAGQTVESALKEFSALPEVLSAEPGYKIK
ncbi:MAG: type II secretion system secretin GspD [Nitrospirae bacterium]|nr:type II secretion system secretin GspD [Nitrospirota bacterium]